MCIRDSARIQRGSPISTFTTQQREQQASDATVIIRAHKEAQTGKVQDLIKICQENGFEKFALRAKEDVGN